MSRIRVQEGTAVLIGELANATGVTPKTLRYWEAEGLLPEPARTPGDYRDYPPTMVNRVGFIRHAQSAGLTLRQIREILVVRDGGQPPCRHVADLVEDRRKDVDQRLRDLARIRRQLRQLEQRLATFDPADCEPSAICSAITAARPRS